MRIFLRPLLIVLFMVHVVGCSHRSVTIPVRPGPLSEIVRAELGTIGIVAGQARPVVDVEVYESEGYDGSGDGATEGAAVGAAVGSQGAMALVPFGILFPPILIAAGGVFLVSTIGGAVAGHSQAPTSPDLGDSDDEVISAFRSVAEDRAVAGMVAKYVASEGKTDSSFPLVRVDDTDGGDVDEEADMRRLAERGVDSLLILQVEQVLLTKGDDSRAPMALDMDVTSTLLRTRDGTELEKRIYTCRGGRRTFMEWKESDGPPFRQGLANCYEKVSARIIEELFLVHASPLSSRLNFGGKGFATVVEDSLEPTLEWKPFSSSSEEPDQHGPPIYTPTVSYDLKMWRAESNDLPGDLVYQRRGLLTTQHMLEAPLKPATRYFWTVRARYEVDGVSRVTPWAVREARRGYSPDRLDRVTNSFYYRLNTPAEES